MVLFLSRETTSLGTTPSLSLCSSAIAGQIYNLLDPKTMDHNAEWSNREKQYFDEYPQEGFYINHADHGMNFVAEVSFRLKLSSSACSPVRPANVMYNCFYQDANHSSLNF